jgi:hypothetical protein
MGTLRHCDQFDQLVALAEELGVSDVCREATAAGLRPIS